MVVDASVPQNDLLNERTCYNHCSVISSPIIVETQHH